MKSLIFNRQSLLFAALLSSAIGVNAQITSTHTDEKYGYTTVVYKDKAATDKEVLNALDSSVGMGDVIRITVAPPKPAAVPTIDKSKGEDVWLKPAKPANPTLTAATAPAINHIPSASPTTVAAKPIAVKTPVAAPKAVTATAAQPVTSVAAPVATQPKATAQQSTAAPKSVQAKTSSASKSVKSANKSLKKSGGIFKKKYRKGGKQRYGCPKF